MPTMAGTTRSQIVVLWVSLFVYALGRICQLYPDKVPALLIVILQVVPPAVFALVHGSILYRVKGMAVFTGFCLGVASISETLGLRTGFPFGHYHFTSLMGPKLLQMPILLVLAYLGIGYCSWVLALLILRNQGKPLMGAGVITLPLLAALIMMAWDLSMDPIWSTLDRAWIWQRRRDVLWRSAQQLLRLVSDRVPVLSSFCALLQSQSGPTGPHVSLLLAVRRCLLRHLCFRKSPDLQKGIVSSSRSRRFGEALAHAGHSDCLRARLFICNGADGSAGVAQVGASRSAIGWKGINRLKTTKPGWFARLSFCGAGSIGLVSSVDPECRFTESSSAPPRLSTQSPEQFHSALGSTISIRAGSPLLDSLHHHRQVLQLELEDWQGAAGHFDAASSVQRRFRRNPIPTAHQKHLEQFGCFVRIDHAPLEQVVPQSRQFGHCESVFVVHRFVDHGRHHLRFRPRLALRY